MLKKEVLVEQMGGEVIEVEVQEKKKINMEKMIDEVMIKEEMIDMKEDKESKEEGVVIEEKIDRGSGQVEKVIIKKGKMNKGDIMVEGSEWGRVREIVNESGENVKEDGNEMKVEIIGIKGKKKEGESLEVVENEEKESEIEEYSKSMEREKEVERK